jgi:hypothetical protein
MPIAAKCTYSFSYWHTTKNDDEVDQQSLFFRWHSAKNKLENEYRIWEIGILLKKNFKGCQLKQTITFLYYIMLDAFT